MDDMQLWLQKKQYLPGESVAGRAQWSLMKSPQRMEIRLFWYTRGQGTQDAEVIDTITVDTLVFQGEREFTFSLPLIPYSFSGKLISLIWAVELVVEPGGKYCREELTFSPTGEEIDITHY
jgi:hypothetical protein